MTVELTEKSQDEFLPVANRAEFVQTVNQCLTPIEKQSLYDYILSGGKPAPASVSSAFFELFYNGCSPEDIHELNPSFDTQAIQWLRIAHKWDETVSLTVLRNNSLIIGKIHKAQTDAAMLMTDMIAVSVKQHQTKLRKYLQTGNPEELRDAMILDNPERFSKMVESLIKLVYREEQTLSIKIPVNKVPHAVHQKVREITSTASSLVSDIAKSKREAARNKIIQQIQDNQDGEKEDE